MLSRGQRALLNPSCWKSLHHWTCLWWMQSTCSWMSEAKLFCKWQKIANYDCCAYCRSTLGGTVGLPIAGCSSHHALRIESPININLIIKQYLLHGDVIFAQTTMAWVREKLFVVLQHPISMWDPRSSGFPVGKVSLTLNNENFGRLNGDRQWQQWPSKAPGCGLSGSASGFLWF